MDACIDGRLFAVPQAPAPPPAAEPPAETPAPDAGLEKPTVAVSVEASEPKAAAFQEAPWNAKGENETAQGPEQKQQKSEESKPAEVQKAVQPWMSEDYEGTESMLVCFACKI